jgi:hypothetical protein
MLSCSRLKDLRAVMCSKCCELTAARKKLRRSEVSPLSAPSLPQKWSAKP